jgi:alkylation response protein AidB-like acyl-CoA dehydrogenase
MSQDVEIKENKTLDEFTKLQDLSRLEGIGGSFLVCPLDQYNVFSKENFSEEQKMFATTAQDFAVNRIKPVNDQLKKLNKDLSLELFKEAGDLGFLGIDIPEQYGGMELDKTTAAIVVDYLSACECPSFMVTLSAHTGIGILPIVWYGNEDQKKKYLTKFATGEWMGCYALTEPNAGSDALAGETTAYLNDEGTHYILNGQKIYITNGSWAEVCITFAKVGDKYTSFIVDKTCEGFVIGAEEKKMGIKGSSTVTLYFENCKVPVENMLGKLGQGGAIAFNSLYAGRYKLGITTAAGAKYTIKCAYDFALERKQFSRSITEFDMLKNKFAQMVVRTFEAYTVSYATTGSIDFSISKLDKDSDDYYEKMQKIIEDHAIEASIAKIVGSVALAENADDGVQIFGGAGFIEEYPAAQIYRDERINRIFEGTNEINKLIIGGTFLKKAILEELPIRDQIYHRMEDYLPTLTFSGDHELSSEISVIELSRSLMLDMLHRLILKYGQDLKNEQWALEPLADIVVCFSVMQMGFARYNQLPDGEHKKRMNCVVKYSIYRNFNILKERINMLVPYICGNSEVGDVMDSINQRINDLKYIPDSIALKKSICEELYKHGKYYLG